MHWRQGTLDYWQRCLKILDLSVCLARYCCNVVVFGCIASSWPKITKPLKVVQTRHNKLSNRLSLAQCYSLTRSLTVVMLVDRHVTAYWPPMLINILWPSLLANKDGGPIGSVFRFWAKDCGMFCCTKPITTKQQSVFWLVSQSRHMSAIFVGSCRWLSLAADPVVLS